MYEGDFKNDEPEGMGVMIEAGGAKFSGRWAAGELVEEKKI